MVWLLFVVLLSLGHSIAVPTKVGVTLGALDLCATGFHHDNRHSALRIRTALRAVLHIKFVQYLFRVCIVLKNLRYLLIALEVHQVNPIDRAPFARMIAIVTV